MFVTSRDTMRAAAVIPSRREVRVLDHPCPRPEQPDDVLVRTLEVGICGTDREICEFLYGAPPAGSEHLVLGHECVGEVLEIGRAVNNLRPGDLVVPSVRRPCPASSCLPCRDGRQDFCATGDFTERGIKEAHGFLAPRFVERERYLTRVPPPMRHAAVLAEPMTIAEKALAQVRAIQARLPDKPATESNAVVLGAGPIGVLGVAALVLRGYRTTVYARSRAPNPKAHLVESLGARYVSAQTTSADELAALTGGIDVVYEAAGSPALAFDVLRVLGINGVFVFTGIPPADIGLNIGAGDLMRSLVLRNQAVVGTVNADAESFRDALRDIEAAQGRWPHLAGALITGRHALEDCRDLLIGERQGIKNTVRFD